MLHSSLDDSYLRYIYDNAFYQKAFHINLYSANLVLVTPHGLRTHLGPVAVCGLKSIKIVRLETFALLFVATAILDKCAASTCRSTQSSMSSYSAYCRPSHSFHLDVHHSGNLLVYSSSNPRDGTRHSQ